MIKSIIVEDELAYSTKLQKLVTSVDRSIEIGPICTNVDQAVEAIQTYKPELVFLDIQLGDNPKAGFDILKKIGTIDFEVIFTTGHVDDNLSEIKLYGLDFLTKSYNREDINDALARYYEKCKEENENGLLNSFIENLYSENISEQKVRITEDKTSYFIRIRNIFYLESNGDHTLFYCYDDIAKKAINYESAIRIGEWEKKLKKHRFLRIHQKHLVNLTQVFSFDPDTRIITLDSKQQLIVSKQNKIELQNILGTV